MAQGHDSQEGLAGRLDRTERKNRQKFLQETQHVKTGSMFFVSLNKKDKLCSIIDYKFANGMTQESAGFNYLDEQSIDIQPLPLGNNRQSAKCSD